MGILLEGVLTRYKMLLPVRKILKNDIVAVVIRRRFMIMFCTGLEKKLNFNALSVNTFVNKTLGRAQDPHANGAWLSKLTE